MSKECFLFDLNKNQLKEIYKTNKNIGWPSKVGNRLVFSVKKNDFEEIVCVNLETQEIYIMLRLNLEIITQVLIKIKLFSRLWEIMVLIFTPPVLKKWRVC